MSYTTKVEDIYKLKRRKSIHLITHTHTHTLVPGGAAVDGRPQLVSIAVQ